MPQMQLPLFPEGSTLINANLAFVREGDRIAYIYGHLPIFSHAIDDVPTFRMITSQLYVNGVATQSEICHAFGVTPISVKRSVKQYRKNGAAVFYEKRGRRGPAVLTPPVLQNAQELLDQGFEVAQVAKELGLKQDTVRKAVRLGRLHKPEKKSVKTEKRMP